MHFFHIRIKLEIWKKEKRIQLEQLLLLIPFIFFSFVNKVSLCCNANYKFQIPWISG